jgi:hypothetical protein
MGAADFLKFLDATGLKKKKFFRLLQTPLCVITLSACICCTLSCLLLFKAAGLDYPLARKSCKF